MTKDLERLIQPLCKKLLKEAREDSPKPDLQQVAEFVFLEITALPADYDPKLISRSGLFQTILGCLEQLEHQDSHGLQVSNSQPTPIALQDARSSGSLERVAAYARAIPMAERHRRALWDSDAPPFPVKHLSAYEAAITQAWDWLENSPEQHFLPRMQFMVMGANAQYQEIAYPYRSRPQIKQVTLPRKIAANKFEWTPTPATHNSHLLTIASHYFCQDCDDDWWSEDVAAVYLLTGVRLGLNDCEGQFSSQPNSRMTIKVFDLMNAREASVREVFNKLRQGYAHAQAKRLQGHPTRKTTELLALLELELIVKAARERMRQDLSVQPEKWQWRPTPKQLLQAWNDYHAFFGTPLPAPSRQTLSLLKTRVPWETYHAAFSYFLCTEDKEEIMQLIADDAR